MSGHYNPRMTPWQIDESAFPAQGPAAEQLRFLLSYAVLAPSGHNTQPWKFRLATPGAPDHAANQPVVLAYADRTRRLPVVDPDDRELIMSVAAALFNLRVAAAHFGLRCDVTPAGEGQPAADHAPADCELVAVAAIEAGQPEPGLAELFPAIARRRTNRAAYEARPLSDEHRACLASLAVPVPSPDSSLGQLPAPSLAGMRLLESHELMDRLAGLIAEGDRVQMSDPAFREELAAWVRPDATGEGEHPAGDGFGLPDLMSWGGSYFVRSLDLGTFQAKRDADRARHAAALAVIFGEDSVPGWLAAGELLERCLLALTALGLQSSYLNSPIQVAHLRAELQSALGLPDRPQNLLRIGYAPAAPHAMPRRRIEDVLIA